MLEVNNIYCDNNLNFIKQIPDNSVDMYLFSPPYDKVRDYKGFDYNLIELGPEIYRTLKDGGVCIMIIQDQTKNFAKSGTTFITIANWITQTPLKLFECLIYNRDGAPGCWWNKRFRVDHEYMPIFFKGEKPQYFDKEHMKIPAKHAGTKWYGTKRMTDGTLTKIKETIQPALKCCGTILRYGSSKNEFNKIKSQHPATAPDKLCYDLIKAFTQEYMTVVDLFNGSGTTCVQCKKLNRNYIACDIDDGYCQIAKQRLDIEC